MGDQDCSRISSMYCHRNPLHDPLHYYYCYIIMVSILLSVHLLLRSNAGCSRSVAIGICYALHKAVPGEVSVQKSLKELRLTRPAANPNQGFMQQLYVIEAKLNSL